MLITFTTNQTPGVGDANDSLCIDDIQMIYNPNLASITPSLGTLQPSFLPNTTAYTVSLPFGTTTTPTLTVTTESPFSTYQVANATDVTSAISADRTSTVVVTGNDGITTKTYTVEFIVEQSDDATLSNLYTSIGTLNPVFNSATEEYTVTLPYGSVNPPLTTAIPTNPGASVQITDALAITSGVSSDRTTYIDVTAENGLNAKSYSILFNVSQYNNDASLNDLTIDGITPNQFHPDTLYYNITLPHSSSNIPVIGGTPNDTNATDTIIQTLSVPGTARIIVTAEDSITVRNYFINFFRAAPLTDATLRDLRVNDTTIAGFSPDTLLYNYYVAVGSVIVPNITATPNDTNAHLFIFQATVIPGQAEINVFAEDSTTIQTYLVNINFANGITGNKAPNTRVFPNPASDYITVESDILKDNAYFILTDINGRTLSNTLVKNGCCLINIKNIPAGLYFYRVYSEKQIFVQGNIQVCK